MEFSIKTPAEFHASHVTIEVKVKPGEIAQAVVDPEAFLEVANRAGMADALSGRVKALEAELAQAQDTREQNRQEIERLSSRLRAFDHLIRQERARADETSRHYAQAQETIQRENERADRNAQEAERLEETIAQLHRTAGQIAEAIHVPGMNEAIDFAKGFERSVPLSVAIGKIRHLVDHGSLPARDEELGRLSDQVKELELEAGQLRRQRDEARERAGQFDLDRHIEQKRADRNAGQFQNLVQTVGYLANNESVKEAVKTESQYPGTASETLIRAIESIQEELEALDKGLEPEVINLHVGEPEEDSPPE